MTNYDQLRALAAAATSALDDEYSLHGFGPPPRITPGMVRCVQQALAQTAPEPPRDLAAPFAGQPISGLDDDEPGVNFAPLPAGDPEAPALERVAAKIRQALARKTEREQPAAAPPTPAPRDSSFRSPFTNDEMRAQALDDIRRIAANDSWCSMDKFDAARSAKMPGATGLSKRLGRTWSQIVAEALGPRAEPPKTASRLRQPGQQKPPQTEAENAETEKRDEMEPPLPAQNGSAAAVCEVAK